MLSLSCRCRQAAKKILSRIHPKEQQIPVRQFVFSLASTNWKASSNTLATATILQQIWSFIEREGVSKICELHEVEPLESLPLFTELFRLVRPAPLLHLTAVQKLFQGSFNHESDAVKIAAFDSWRYLRHQTVGVNCPQITCSLTALARFSSITTGKRISKCQWSASHT